MSLSHYDYDLPTSLIAQEPLANRSDSRLLVVDRQTQSFQHRTIKDLPEFLKPNDCLVLNNTKVIPARLVGTRTQTGGRWEGLFLQQAPPKYWQIIGKTKGKIVPDETVLLQSPDGKSSCSIQFVVQNDDHSWLVEMIDGRRQTADGSRKSDFVALESQSKDCGSATLASAAVCGLPSAVSILDRIGWTPIPPYIRKGKPLSYDKERYQTVYAEQAGSVAAPTAGLHFTPELLDTLQQRGIKQTSVTLHVGMGTFKPITAENIEEHHMHSEWGSLSKESVSALKHCRSVGGRVVAVGTTSVRVLESASDSFVPFEGTTSLFIRPPYRFRHVDVLLTNFHFPRSTLLILVRTFGGDELIREAYQEAVKEKYRFFSYGDAMLIV